jgi:hypothetical protein
MGYPNGEYRHERGMREQLIAVFGLLEKREQE